MNREALLTGAPSAAQWATMKSVDKQAAVVDLAIAVLDGCAAQGGELDAWETHYLRSALGAIYTNFFSLAWTGIVKAMAPIKERAPGWEQFLAGEIPTTEQFLAAFDLARYRPIPGA